MSCQAPPDAFLDARLAGAIDASIAWHAADMDCDGMRRPDGQGLRVTFSGARGSERLTLVFAAPRLAEGAAGHAVPVNVTLIREGGGLYSTRGEDKCLHEINWGEYELMRPDCDQILTRQAGDQRIARR